ncbi:SWIM zinc finger family protein [Paenibacillus abyssi]|uniref:SWIM-type domain-containing protein n=1 Tax=Paenibacillus abyssi TaxID=1340531 RepID=A0A917CU43_9BACL|nr:SWIM zinc finger family protein [Paenibacillus abyssi]GGF98385.1 hypothetical protein GCM10010916_14540 [Paenibacillus abyssi]
MDALIRLVNEQLAYLEQQFAALMPRHILSRGWDYYRSRKVTTVEVVEGNAIYGTVNGSGVYAVVLDADEFTYSKCTCPYQGYCKHMAAVFFHYSAMTGGDAETIYLRTTGEVTLTENAQAADISPNRPNEENDVHVWREWFHNVYGEVWRQCKQSLYPMQPILSEMKGTAKHWERVKQRLHWLHTLEFVLEQVEKAYAATDSYNRYYYEMSFTRTVDPWILHFNELAAALKPASFTEEEEQWVLALVDVLRKRALNAETTLLRWDFLYHVVWEALSSDEQWRASERLQLQAEALNVSPLLVKPFAFVQSTLACLDVIENQDEHAVARMKQADFDRTSELVYGFAEQKLEQRQWALFSLWMDYLEEQLASCRNAVILKPFLTLCRKADILQPEQPGWTDRMIAFLPAAYQELSEHWLENGHYARWADLQLYLGIRPDELDIQDVRSVSKAAPRVLIPLYHQAIDESITSRNRQGYRAAVKLIKKLEKLYKAENKPVKWESYIQGLVSKYSRLRALQEELWKGKVVT